MGAAAAFSEQESRTSTRQKLKTEARNLNDLRGPPDAQSALRGESKPSHAIAAAPAMRQRRTP